MRRVFANLVTNAIQAAGKGEAKIDIRVSVDEAKGLVCLRFDDNGPGVPAETKVEYSNLTLQPRARAPELGLAIVKRLSSNIGDKF